MNSREDFLRRQVLCQPLAENAEEIGLLDVFFAIENGSGVHKGIVSDRGGALPIVQHANLGKAGVFWPAFTPKPPLTAANASGLRSAFFQSEGNMDVSADVGFRQRPAWLVIVAILLVGQGWMTLRLFTTDDSLDRLSDDQPIVSGRHALHFYHGLLGAKTWQARGTSCCFDPGLSGRLSEDARFRRRQPARRVLSTHGRPAARVL